MADNHIRKTSPNDSVLTGHRQQNLRDVITCFSVVLIDIVKISGGTFGWNAGAAGTIFFKQDENEGLLSSEMRVFGLFNLSSSALRIDFLPLQ